MVFKVLLTTCETVVLSWQPETYTTVSMCPQIAFLFVLLNNHPTGINTLSVTLR